MSWIPAPLTAYPPGFSGNQPVSFQSPADIEVGHGQPASANWPGPNVVPPTNPTTINANPAFVGDQPNEMYPPVLVDVDHGQPPSANWPRSIDQGFGTWPS